MRRIIRLTENDLHRLVLESVQRAMLNEKVIIGNSGNSFGNPDFRDADLVKDIFKYRQQTNTIRYKFDKDNINNERPWLMISAKDPMQAAQMTGLPYDLIRTRMMWGGSTQICYIPNDIIKDLFERVLNSGSDMDACRMIVRMSNYTTADIHRENRRRPRNQVNVGGRVIADDIEENELQNMFPEDEFRPLEFGSPNNDRATQEVRQMIRDRYEISRQGLMYDYVRRAVIRPYKHGASQNVDFTAYTEEFGKLHFNTTIHSLIAQSFRM